MTHFARNNENYYWNGGAFCVNCGKLEGNVTNNGVHPIWHNGCKPGCNSTWEDQDAVCEDYEYAQLMDEEERWAQAQYDPREEEEEEEAYLAYEREMDTLSRKASCTGPPMFPMELLVDGYDITDLILRDDEYEPYDEETECEARREYDREMDVNDEREMDREVKTRVHD